MGQINAYRFFLEYQGDVFGAVKYWHSCISYVGNSFLVSCKRVSEITSADQRLESILFWKKVACRSCNSHN